MHPLRQHIAKVVSITDTEFELILSGAKLRKLKKNQLLLEEGDYTHSDFFVLEGCLCQYYLDSSGKEHVNQFSFPNWWTGDWDSILNHTPSSYYIEAVQPSKVLQFDYSVLQQLFESVPALQRYFLLIFQKGFAAQQRRIRWMQQPPKERYEEFKRIYGYFESSIPQRQIASYLGITRESLNRLKKRAARGTE